jgi:hypothetical protein
MIYDLFLFISIEVFIGISLKKLFTPEIGIIEIQKPPVQKVRRSFESEIVLSAAI